MRDKLKTKEYWNTYVFQIENLRDRSFERLKNSLIVPERILIVKRSLSYSYLESISSKYSKGDNVNTFMDDLTSAINLIKESWIEDFGVKFNYNGKFLNQFIEYDQMLWMLSFGYLLNISNDEFQKLVDIIDKHQVKDYLYEFIIRAKIKDRKPITEESYEYGWILFGKLRQAITETDKTKAEKLVKEFITKDWYKEHKNTGWYNSHKNPYHDTYFGYWSFETAAVVKIMGLDDSSFRDCQYYSKDLVSVE